MAAALKSKGWHISEEAYLKCMNDVSPSVDLHHVLLNTNLKDVAVAALPADFPKSKVSKVAGPIILQIQKIRNITAPTVRPESTTAPRMFKFSLTDGIQTVSAIEMDLLHGVGFDTSPGAKILLKGTVPVSMNILQLTNSNCTFLGGKVIQLYDKWQLNKELMKISRNVNRSDGPPPFVPFGQRIKKEQVQELSGRFKSLDIANANQDAGEQRDDAEFKAQRKAVISEVVQQSSGPKKVYGGIKQNSANEPLQISEFKRPEKKVRKPTLEDKDPNVSDDEDGGRGRYRRGRKGRHNDDEDSFAPSRPSATNTLFDFFDTKVDGKQEQGPGHGQSQGHSQGQRYGQEQGYRHSYGQGQEQNHRHSQGQGQMYGQSHRHSQGQRYGEGQEQGHRHSQGHRQGQGYSQSYGQELGHRHSHGQEQGHRHSQGQGQIYGQGHRQGQSRAEGGSRGNKGRFEGSTGTPRTQAPHHQQNSRQHSSTSRDSDYIHNRKDFQNTGDRRADNRHGENKANGKTNLNTASSSKNSTNVNKSSEAVTQYGSEGGVSSTSRQSTRGQRSKQDIARYQPPGSSRPDSGSSRNLGNQETSTNHRPSSTSAGSHKDAARQPTSGRNEAYQRPQSAQAFSQSTAKAHTQTNRQNPTLTQNSSGVRQGNVVMAKYWEDGQFYRFKVLNHLSPAVVVGIFLDYGNTEEVNINDIKPIHNMLTHQPQYSEYEGEYSQGLCFSRKQNYQNQSAR